MNRCSGALRWLLAAVALGQAALGSAITVALWERDYSDNTVAADRVWFYKNQDGSARPAGGGQYPAVEWTTTTSFPVVYQRGDSMTIVLKFYNPNCTAVSGTLTLNGARLYAPEPLAPLGQTRYSSPSVSGGGSMTVPATQLFPTYIPGYATKTITVSGLPDAVTHGQLQVDATFVANGQTAWTTGGYQTWETVYETQSDPVGLQAIPWTDLLALACTWAHAEDGDDADVLKELTFGLFWSALWVYDYYETYYTDIDTETGAVSYDLTHAVQHSIYNMDCQDASGLLHLAAAANGIESELTVLTSDDEGFWSNLLCGLGNDASQIGPYENFPFAFHQVLVAEDAVFDAACAQLTDWSGDWYRNPPAGPGWDLAGFWQTEVSRGVFYGLAYSYYADPMPEDPEEVGLYYGARELSAIF
ncbi:MAG: hypothetical protein KIS66_00700 [Fimbriimonadaceae bacterium]|nr:hypothetical protein [Fimbriimonadaceae bacterium]